MSAIRLLPAANTRASLAVDGPASATWNTVVEAVAEGPPGNLVTLAAVADAVRASLDLDTVTGDLDTIVEAVELGVAGNDITVEVVGDSGAAEGVTIDEDLDALTVVIHFETAVSTVGDVETAITATATLIQVKTAGTGATVLDAATDETAAPEPLVGGVDFGFTVSGNDITLHFATGETLVSEVEAEIAADAAVAALMRVKTAGTTQAYELVVTDDDFSATNLTGGGVTSSAAPTLTDANAGKHTPLTADQVLLLLRNVDTATGTTKTVVGGKLWGFSPVTERWYLIGAINNGNDVAETSTDAINYCELVVGARGFTRFAFSFTSLGGAGTEVEVYLDCFPANSTTH